MCMFELNTRLTLPKSLNVSFLKPLPILPLWPPVPQFIRLMAASSRVCAFWVDIIVEVS